MHGPDPLCAHTAAASTRRKVGAHSPSLRGVKRAPGFPGGPGTSNLEVELLLMPPTGALLHSRDEDRSRQKTTSGGHTINRLCNRKPPYRMHECFQHVDAATLFDDALARTLGRLVQAGSRLEYGTIASMAARPESVNRQVFARRLSFILYPDVGITLLPPSWASVRPRCWTASSPRSSSLGGSGPATYCPHLYPYSRCPGGLADLSA